MGLGLRFFFTGWANPRDPESGADATEVAGCDGQVKVGLDSPLELRAGGMRVRAAIGDNPGGKGIAEFGRMAMAAINEGARPRAAGPHGEPIGGGATDHNPGGVSGLVPPRPRLHCGNEAGFRVLTRAAIIGIHVVSSVAARRGA